jgi:chitinase
MVSAFGSTDTPTTSGEDPTKLAETMAAWVKKYNLDGIDVDYEASSSLSGTGDDTHFDIV